jgi:uncharacterized membrane protein YhiD involved in acid resistance
MAEFDFILPLLASLLLGGIIALFIKALYQRFGSSISDQEAFSTNFVPLTITTILVISVVKSSLALSLGLVGALSIVRFRAAIKDPEELVYLFFCIAVGLALGANKWIEAIVGVLAFTIFVLSIHFVGRRRTNRRQNLLLTLTMDKSQFFPQGGQDLPMTAIEEIIGQYKIQRLECDNDQVQFRATIKPSSENEIPRMMAAIQEKLPGCRVSYVNLQNLI